MLKSVLLLLVGVLVGANIVYFVMTRDAPRAGVTLGPAPTPAGGTRSEVSPADSGATPPKATAASPSPPAMLPGVSPPRTAPIATPSAAPPTPAGGLLLPVQGVRAAQLTDTYNDVRGGGTRTHEALDIMAARGTPVVAVADGVVVKLFDSRQGGLTVYQFDATSTYAYYYAHLDAYAPGLREGQVLRRGDSVGTVGSTGNASPDAPHLHFAIFLLGPEKRWSEGTPVNPYPLLAGR